MKDPKVDVGVGQMIFTSLQKFSDRILLYDTDNDKTITYSDILSQSIRTALKLKQKGITRNDIIGTCTYNQKFSLVPFIAAQFLGAVTITFDQKLSPMEVEHFLKLVRPRILFVAEETLGLMENCLKNTGVITELVVFGESKKYNLFIEFLQTNDEEQHFLPVDISNVKDTAILLFTSGTTGLPKAVCFSHLSVLHLATSFPPFSVTNKIPPVSLLFTTLYWITGIANCISCITHGHSTAICKAFDPAVTWRLIQKYKITMLFLGIHIATEFINENHQDVDASSIEVVVIGGSLVSANLIKEFREQLPNARIINGYSQTEFADVPCIHNPSIEKEYNYQLLKPTSVGVFRTYVEWKFVNTESEETLGPNQTGELRIKSPYLMTGYYKMDTSVVFDSDGFLKTGDVGYYDEDECIYIVGRIKEMFKYRGHHIVPLLLEEILMSHPAVKQAVVLGVPNEEDGEHPMGVVTLLDEHKDTKAVEILNFANQKLADFQKLRAGVKILDTLPTTPTGKIKRNDLKKNIIDEINNSV